MVVIFKFFVGDITGRYLFKGFDYTKFMQYAFPYSFYLSYAELLNLFSFLKSGFDFYFEMFNCYYGEPTPLLKPDFFINEARFSCKSEETGLLSSEIGVVLF